MKLKKVHRVVRFLQSNFLKEYIDFCTFKRATSNTSFLKRMYKLFVNAVFGKFIEQVRNHLDAKICTSTKDAEKWITSPRFSNMKIISDDLVIVFLTPARVFLNKPYSIGFSILDLSKYFMFSHYYGKIKPLLGNCEVLFSDTDSLSLAVYNKQKTNNILKLKKMLDFSNYDSTHCYHTKKKANKLGYWKDELKGEKMIEYVGLRSKCYAIRIKNKQHKNLKSTCKGVRKGVKKNIPFRKFKKCIQKVKKQEITQFNIRSRSHQVNTMKMQKVGFTSFDDKRYLMKCGIHSVPYGSCVIKQCEKKNICPFCL